MPKHGHETLYYRGTIQNLRDSYTPQINAVTRLFLCPAAPPAAPVAELRRFGNDTANVRKKDELHRFPTHIARM